MSVNRHILEKKKHQSVHFVSQQKQKQWTQYQWRIFRVPS